MEFLAEKGSIETMKKYTDKHRDNIPGKDYQTQPHLCPFLIERTTHRSICPWVPGLEKSLKSPFILNVVLRKHMCCFYVAIYDSISYSTKRKIYDLSEIYSKAIDSVNVFLGNRSFFGNTCT